MLVVNSIPSNRALVVLVTPEIKVDGTLDEKCGAECDWRGRFGKCELFDDRCQSDEAAGWHRLDVCHEAERKYAASEEQ